MKGSFLRPRGKRLHLAIAGLCSALVIWSWEKTTLATTFLPPPNSFQARPSSVVPWKSPSLHDLKHEKWQHNLSEQKDAAIGASFKEEIVNKGCKYNKGKWVADRPRPFYSGFGCKQWLSDMWACRLTKRKDFSYEIYRWQPFDCEMPEFEGSEFLRRMHGKTIAFVGDSLGRQQFQSLLCMITKGVHFPKVQDVGEAYGLVKQPGATRPDGWAYRFSETATTILYYWSATLCDLAPLNSSDASTTYAMHLDRPASFLRTYIDRFDVLVLNTGHHWNRGKVRANRWEIFVGGVPNTDRRLAPIGNAKNFTIHNMVKWVDSHISRHHGMKVFFRSISPRHFSNGDWNSGGRCDNTRPLVGGSEVVRDGSGDVVVESAVKGSRVRVLDITTLSEVRDEGHISRYGVMGAKGVQDCLHWCLPGVPDTWNEILCAQL